MEPPIDIGEEETDWFALEIWGKDAEYLSNYVTKGARVGVTGQLACDTWMRKDNGNRGLKPKVIVNIIDVLESRAEAQLRGGGNKKQQYSKNNNYDDGNDDLLGDSGYSTGFKTTDPPSAGSGSFF